MPNTRADLERLRHHWQDVCRNSWGPEHVDELLAMVDRLLTERTDAREHACKAIATAMGARDLLEITRAETEQLKAGIADAADQSRMAAKDAATNAGNMCEDEPYAAQVWRRWEEQAEELQSSLEALLNPEGSNDDG